MSNTENSNKYRIFFINFGYYAHKECDTLDEAKQVAKNTGWQSVISLNGEKVICWCPIGGFRKYL
jgi:hypothetical protein